MVALVLVETKHMCLEKSFAYLVPDHLRNQVKVGKRVMVSFRSRIVEGFIIDFSTKEKYDFALKSIIEVIDQEEVLSNELLKLGQYMKEKTVSPLIYCYQTILPKGIRASIKNKIKTKKEQFLVLNREKISGKLSDAAKKIISLFDQKEEILKKNANLISNSAVKTLIKKEILFLVEKEKTRESIKVNGGNLILNKEQKSCFEQILKKRNSFMPFLLHGVTGSGKTEIYLQVIAELLKEDKQIIVLVPEISLTPQIVGLFKKKFGNLVAVFHSHLGESERYQTWLDIKQEKVKIVIGARSAVFAPFANLGLIIIDEEYASTYKQENMPRYNTIDIALWRGKYHRCPVILAGATPSVESYLRAQKGIYQLLEMKKSINDLSKEVIIIDMKEQMKSGNRYLASILLDEIEKRIAKKEQVILFLNRRGYSTTLVCRDCGEVMKCPNCEISLTYHRQSDKVKCHYCYYEKKFVGVCPNCNGVNLRHFGLGTQKLEEEILKKIKGARVVRMDNDTTRKKGSHEKIITDFVNHRYDILIGTQMVSKGLDFANVTLVGVINGDASLNLPDFRSAERTFQLINQVAGRAGRFNKRGKVIVQCFNPNHYSIKAALANDYQLFYDQEIAIRKKLNYPPFVHLTLIKLSATNFDYLFLEAEKISKLLKRNKKLIVLGPTIGSVLKKNKKYFVQIIIKYSFKDDLKNELKYLQDLCGMGKLRIEIDINPLNL